MFGPPSTSAISVATRRNKLNTPIGVSPRKAPLPHPEQARGIFAKNGRFLLVGERIGGKDVVHGMLLPWDRVIAAEHDLACADLRHQMAQRLGREHERVEVELLEVFAWLLLELDVGIAVLWRDEAGMVGAR